MHMCACIYIHITRVRSCVRARARVCVIFGMKNMHVVGLLSSAVCVEYFYKQHCSKYMKSFSASVQTFQSAFLRDILIVHPRKIVYISLKLLHSF
jgi:hypothetical protein